MSLPSPVDQYGNKMSGSGYGSSGQSDSGKGNAGSPLSMSLGFLKNLTEKKSTRVDGQPPKRRGPKPDSKPALTRRQELNRQAQRTHRERKELYIKALEQEVLRLKENFSMVSRNKDSLAEENRQLKRLLAQHGIPWTGSGGVDELTLQPSAGFTSSGSISGSYGAGSQTYSPPPQTTSSNSNLSPTAFGMNGMNGRSMAQQQVQPGVDYDQAGIDFVLTLERPCMDHLQFLVERASEPEGDFCGHALMASCPPAPEPEAEVPFGHGPRQNGSAQKTWDLSKSDLSNLLDLSKRLNLDGEITPVMAWGMVLGHPRFADLRSEDFERLSQELKGKIRCYGFGAVLEEFEVRDALANVLNFQPHITMHFSRILAILAASAIVSAAPAMKDTSGADSSMNSGMGMAVKDKDVMMGADHMDGAMIENGKDGIIANGILRISRAERGIMGKDGMMSKEGMMGKDEMNTLGITKDSGMTFHEEHATGMGNKMIKSMIKRDSLEHTMDEEAGTGMGMKDHLSNTHAMGHGGVDTSM